MSNEIDALVEKIRLGAIDPVSATAGYVNPLTHIKDIPVRYRIKTLETGFPTLDQYMLFKQQCGELVVLGARPSHGKTAFMMQLVYNVAQRPGGNVAVFSLEMGKEALKRRLIALHSKRSLTNIQRGIISSSELEPAKKFVEGLNFYIDDRGGLDIKTIRQTVLQAHEKTPFNLVTIDYLQLIKSSSENSTRNAEISEITAELKTLAKQLNCPVLILSQLNRECERRGLSSGDFRPSMSDLRDSGSIEQDADAIFFISRHEVYTGERQGEADIVIAKVRDGATGSEVFKFLGGSTTFLDPGGML